MEEHYKSKGLQLIARAKNLQEEEEKKAKADAQKANAKKTKADAPKAKADAQKAWQVAKAMKK